MHRGSGSFAIVLLLFTRFVSPPALNVNVSLRSYFELPYVQSHDLDIVLNLLLFAGVLRFVEQGLRRLLPCADRPALTQ